MESPEYLSPRDLGRAVGLSESSVRRWADDGRLRAERTAGGHRRIARAEAVRFIRETGLELLRPDLLGYARADVPGEEGVPPADALLEALQSDDSRVARRMLVSAFLDGAPLSSLCDGPIRAALREIGVLAARSPEGMVDERRAIETCLQALMEIRSAVPESREAPIALGGAIETDPYILPSVMASAVLADLGFRAFNLGVDLPRVALVSAARTYSPVLVWRTVAVEGASILPEAREIESLPADRRPAFVVGGRGLAAGDLRGTGNVHRLHSMGELAGFGRALLAARG